MAASRESVEMPVRGAGWAGVRSGWTSVVAIVTLVALAVWSAWQSGGYFPPAFLAAGAVAFFVTAALLVVRPPRPALPARAVVAIAAVVGLAVWMGVSAGWSPVPATAVEDAQRALAYAAVLGLALLAAVAAGSRRQIPWIVLAAIVVIVGAGLGSRLLPDVISSPAPLPQAGFRLDYPLGYSNAYGALAAIGIVLGLGLGEDRLARPLPRALAVAAAVPLATAVYLSLSRGAWMALAVGLVVLLLVGRRRPALLLTMLVVAAATALVIALLQDYPALIDGPRPGHPLGQGGGDILALVLGLAVVVGALQLAVTAVERRHEGALPRWAGVVAAVVAGGVILVGGGVALADSARVERFVSRQWHDFLRPAGQPSQSGRLGSVKGPRSDFYRVALDGFEAQPWRGVGSGGFEPRYVRDRRTDETARDVHSLYLEILSELGIVGGLILAAFIAATIVGIVAVRRRPGVLGAGAAAAAGAAWATWLVHAGVDWDWQMPALTLLGLMLVATLLVRDRAASE
jgi:O-antigen ligase/polysaccharide polymerase Wzy-like membrane protein